MAHTPTPSSDNALDALAAEFADELSADAVGDEALGLDDIAGLDGVEMPVQEDEEEDLAPDGAISDAAVAGDLAALSLSLAREGHGGGHDSEDELEKFEREEIMKEKKKKQAAAAAAAAAAAKSAPKPASSTPASASVSSSPAPARVDSALVALLTDRLKEYRLAAVTEKRAGRLEAARDYLSSCRLIEAALQAAQRGAKVDVEDIPKKIQKNNQTAKTAAPAPASSSSSSASSRAPGSLPPTAVLPSSIGVSLSVREDLSYDTIIEKLNEQIKELTEQIRIILGPPSSSSSLTPSASTLASPSLKLLAVQYHRWKKRSQTDLELVIAARKKHLPPPSVHEEAVKMQEEVKFPSLASDELSVELLQAIDVRPSRDSGIKPEDVNAFVVCKFDYNGSESSCTTDVKRKCGANPQFSFTHSFKVDPPSKASARKMRVSKLTFTVYHKRSFLQSSLELGHGELKLKDLVTHSEIGESLRLKAADARKAGELRVRVRMREPLEGAHIRECEKHYLVVDEFFESKQSKHENNQTENKQTTQTATAAAAPVAAAAAGQAGGEEKKAEPAASSAAAPPALPAGLTAADLADPHSISDMFSNDVLECEIASLESALKAADGDQQDELRDRLMRAQTQLTVLVTAVQNGNLALPDYLAKLRESIQREKSLAVALNQRARKGDAIRCMKRMKIMENEVKQAEENMDQLEEE